MARIVVLKGRIASPTSVVLDEALPPNAIEVEVHVSLPDQEVAKEAQSLSDFLRALPPGKRTKEDIDRQLREERNW
jgi:hypothetical protein